MKTVALFGGSFDPIHQGHIKVARMAMKQCGCSEVWFIPAYHTPLKECLSVDFTMRCRMLELALRPYRKFKICAIEQLLPSPSYTINTVKTLQRKHPDIKFIWLIGEDQAIQLNQWKAIDELVKRVSFVVLKRSQNSLKCDYPHILLEDFHHPASSTLIKQGSFQYLSKSVLRYILEHSLYIDEIVSSRCSEKRFKHCQSVAKEAKALAKIWGINEHKAYLAGLLHDICKELPTEESGSIMKAYYPDKMILPKQLWHAYTAMYFLKHHLYIHDHKIIQAVGNHVEGNNYGKMATLIYICDKIEPLRGYDNSEEMALIQRNLKATRNFVANKQKDFILKKENIHV